MSVPAQQWSEGMAQSRNLIGYSRRCSSLINEHSQSVPVPLECQATLLYVELMLR
jgi:hypothetical protein